MNTFSTKDADDDLRRYKKQGPDATTRALIDAIRAEGIEGASLLDIGGGIGAIQLELLAAGLGRSWSVDASEAYVAVARDEAARREYTDRASHRFGTLADVQADLEPADVVTLDRVVCCSSDLPALLGTAVDRARRMVGLVYPRPTWWNRVAARVINAFGWLTRDPTRWHLHPEEEIREILRRAGFERRDIDRTFIWQVALYVRPTPNAA
ncbi:MAG TPA: methyltransferase domain-containing protein [Candidatus Limnocylindrales bacterium]|nr:methyltransferase domain-containing protein [Candidatus Limnocylindrales bacterium]